MEKVTVGYDVIRITFIRTERDLFEVHFVIHKQGQHENLKELN